jgi:S1-C subfamily serine protease
MGMSLADLKVLSASGYLANQPPLASAPATVVDSPAASSAPPVGPYRGALVARVASAGPASAAGIQTGGVISNVAGAEIYNRDEPLKHLVRQNPGDTIPVTLTRNGHTLGLSLTLAESRAP